MPVVPVLLSVGYVVCHRCGKTMPSGIACIAHHRAVPQQDPIDPEVRMQHTRIVERVRREGGATSWSAAEQATQATLGALGARLSPSLRLAVVLRLPAALASEVDEAAEAEDFDVGELYARVAAATGRTTSDARDQTRVVVSALQEESAVDLAEVLAALPTDYADLLGSETSRSARP